MPGVTPSTYASRLTQIQSFKEVAWGTVGAATARWMGLAPYPSFKPFQKSTNYDEDRGSLQNAFNSNVLQLGGEFSLNFQYATYEDINFLLMCALQAVTPTGGNPYVYTYLAPKNAVNSLQSYTLEWGYDILTGRFAGCLGNKFTIKGEAKKQWEASLSGFYKSYDNYAAINIASSTNANPIEITTASPHPYATGDQVVITGHLVNTNANGTWVITKTGASTFTLTGSTGNGIGANTGTVAKIQTPAIADRTVEAIIFPGTALAIEGPAGSPGTTPFANVLLGFQLDAETQLNPIWGGDAKTPIAYAQDKVKPSLMLKLLYNAQVKALENTLLGGGRAVVQLKQTSGAKIAEIDFAGVLADDPQHYGNDSGAAFIDLKLEGQYDTGTLANQLKVEITNAVSALP